MKMYFWLLVLALWVTNKVERNNVTIIKTHHDIEALSRQAGDLLSLFGKLSDTEEIKKMIDHWHGPGWTTPAEYWLVSKGLENLNRHAEILLDMRASLLKGVELVGAR